MADPPCTTRRAPLGGRSPAVVKIGEEVAQQGVGDVPLARDGLLDDAGVLEGTQRVVGDLGVEPFIELGTAGHADGEALCVAAE